VNNMFFKLVRDLHGIYGGDLGASKAAKQEIRSLEALVACGVEGVFFPLMCLVDYLGLRIICTSIIPGTTAHSSSLRMRMRTHWHLFDCQVVPGTACCPCEHPVRSGRAHAVLRHCRRR
jgi:hypothetical protein